jgi:hypothetical protein
MASYPGRAIFRVEGSEKCFLSQSQTSAIQADFHREEKQGGEMKINGSTPFFEL